MYRLKRECRPCHGEGLFFQIMANTDELCQLARLGQTAKIQKYLQIHSEYRTMAYLHREHL
jgi:hypothetical protein